eukprot:3583693-Amphidinium_carterae.2
MFGGDLHRSSRSTRDLLKQKQVFGVRKGEKKYELSLWHQQLAWKSTEPLLLMGIGQDSPCAGRLQPSDLDMQ